MNKNHSIAFAFGLMEEIKILSTGGMLRQGCTITSQLLHFFSTL